MTPDPAFEVFWKANEFKPLEVIRGDIKVELGWYLEGRGENYDHTDPDDYPALRFTVWHRASRVQLSVQDGRLLRRLHLQRHEWQEVKDGSQRTQLSAIDPKDKLQWALDFIVDLVVPRVEQGLGIRGLCRWLSRIHKDGITLKARNTGM